MHSCSKIRIRLLERMVSCSFEGYDPSAIFFSKRLMKIKNLIDKLPTPFLRRVLRAVLFRAIYYSGNLAVKLLNPQKTTYAKGLALVLSGLTHQEDSRNSNLKVKLVDMIVKKKLPGKLLWAHDIDYSFPGGTEVTKETPNLVTTAFVANAFYDLYKSSGLSKDRNYFLGIVEDLLEYIPYKVISDDEICFMYTPVTDYHVHNANLLYSELLAKYIEISDRDEDRFIELIEKSLRYSLNDFKKTGTYPYAGPETRKYAVDNYHTGYLLRALFEINKIVGDKLTFDLPLEIEKLLKFYLSHFIKNGVVIKDSRNTVESHSLAETILVFKIFNGYMSARENELVSSAISRTVSMLYDLGRGCFINNRKRILFWYLKDSTEMIRWSNSWMYYALSYNPNNHELSRFPLTR